MASKKKAAKKTAVVEILSDEELVISKSDEAECVELDKGGFIIADGDLNLSGRPAKTESDAWKKAAHTI